MIWLVFGFGFVCGCIFYLSVLRPRRIKKAEEERLKREERRRKSNAEWREKRLKLSRELEEEDARWQKNHRPVGVV